MEELTVTNDIDMNTDLIDDTLDSVDMIDDESLNEEVEEMNINLKNNIDKRNKLKEDANNTSTYVIYWVAYPEDESDPRCYRSLERTKTIRTNNERKVFEKAYIMYNEGYVDDEDLGLSIEEYKEMLERQDPSDYVPIIRGIEKDGKVIYNFDMNYEVIPKNRKIPDDYYASLNEDFEPSFFDEEDTSGFRSDAQSLINRLNVLDYMDDYDSFRDFVDNEFSAALLGSWGNEQEMDELFRYFVEQAPEQAKIGKRIWKDSGINEDWDMPVGAVEAQSPSMSGDVRDMHDKDSIRRKKLDADNKNALDKNFKFDKMKKITLDESVFIKRR